MKVITNTLACPALALASAICCAQSFPQTEQMINIEAQPIVDALSGWAKQTGLQIIVPEMESASGLSAPSVKGSFTAQEALRRLLQGTSLTYEVVNDRTVVIHDRASVTRLVPIRSEGTELELRLAAAQSSTGHNAEGSPGDDRSEGGMAREGKRRLRGDGLEEVVVTAQKREENLQEVPISIAVLDVQELDSRGINDLHSLSLAVPGVFVQENGGIERRVSIRGIGNVFGSSATVGAYIDEAVAIGLPGDGQLDLQTYDLARVEVLRGPQGTLYGQGSMGGTIRYVTADPELGRAIGETDVSASFTEGGDPTERVRGVVNIPLVDDKLGVRIAGIYENVGGWIDQPALSKSSVNDHELFNVRTKLLWKPTEQFDLTGLAIIHRHDVGALGTGADENGNFQQSLLDPSTPSASIDYELFNVTGAYEFSSVQLLSTTTYLNIDAEQRKRGHECCSATPHLDSQWIIDREIDTGEVLTQEVRLASAASGPLRWTVGGFYQDAEYLDDWGPEINNFFGAPGGTLDVDLFHFSSYAKTISKSWAAFGEASYELTSQFSFGVGLRYFEDDRRLQSAPGDVFQEGTFNSTNPRVFVNYAVNDDVNVYASAAKGFRSGGFNAAGQPPYKPESLWSYEIGTKMTLLDRHLSVELALSHSDYQDYQIIGFLPGNIGNITSNVGEARIQGIDGLLAWRGGDVELGISGSYVDAEFTAINATSASHAVGDPLDLVPEYSVSMWTVYKFNWSSNGENSGFARLDYSQQGISHFRNRSFANSYHSTSDVIGLLNARLGWENGRWTAELFAQNLLNENGFDSPLSIERAATRPWPRSYGLQVGIRFD